jgi:uncharacterized protein YciI
MPQELDCFATHGRAEPSDLTRALTKDSEMRSIVFVFAAVALGQRTWPPPGLWCPERTLVLYELNPENVSRMGRFSKEHNAYLLNQMKAGRIVSAGKTDSGGAAVFVSKEWDKVEQTVKADPYIREGVARVASHTVWNACEPEK